MLAAIFDAINSALYFLWLPNAALLVTPLVGVSLVTVFSMKHAARPLRGCQNCGYDLRESIDRCPECGKSFGVPERECFEFENALGTQESADTALYDAPQLESGCKAWQAE